MLFERQWGSLGISNSTDFYIESSATTFVSIRDLAEDTIDYYPEVAAYSQKVLDKDFGTLSPDSVKRLFEKGGTSQSLLNQVNVHNFFHYYENGDFGSIKKRFGFTEDVQCEALHNYLTTYPAKLVYFEEEGGTVQASMMQRMLNLTLGLPRDTMLDNRWLAKEMGRRYVYT